MTQGEHLGKLMDQRGISVAELARRSGVARESISKIVNDKRTLGNEVAQKIAKGLGVTPPELVLPREAEVASRRGLDRRLSELEAEVAEILRAQALLLLDVDDARTRLARVESDRTPRATGRPKKAAP